MNNFQSFQLAFNSMMIAILFALIAYAMYVVNANHPPKAGA